MKSILLRWLYENGYCVSATINLQKLKCRHCDNGVSHWWDEDDGYDDAYDREGHSCGWCEGTGVYKTIKLIRFVFDVEGHRFVWHQPDSLVCYPVALTSDVVRDYADRPRDGTRDNLTNDHLHVLSLTVRLFLHSLGLWKRPKLRTVGAIAGAVRDDVMAVVRDYYYRVKLWSRWRRADMRKLTERLRRIRPPANEEIPF